MVPSKVLHLALGIGISAITLFLAFRHVSLHALGHVLWKGHYGWLVPATVLLLAIYALRAFFWKQTLSVTRAVSLQHLFSSVVVGYMANNILPFRGGEMVRALFTRKIENLPLPVILSTIFIERLFDLVSLSLLFFVLLVTSGHSAGHKGLWIMSGTIGVFLALSALVQGRNRILAFLDDKVLPLARGHRWAARILHTIGEVLHGLSSLTSRVLLVRLFLTSLSIWGLTLLLTGLFLLTFGITAHLLEATIALLVFTNLAMLVPASPGGIGVLQLATVYALEPYQVSGDRAIALSLVTQALTITVTGVMGYGFIVRSNFSLFPRKDPVPAPVPGGKDVGAGLE